MNNIKKQRKEHLLKQISYQEYGINSYKELLSKLESNNTGTKSKLNAIKACKSGIRYCQKQLNIAYNSLKKEGLAF